MFKRPLSKVWFPASSRPWSACLGAGARGEEIAAEFDADRHLAGIEILDAVKRLGDPSAFNRITLEDVGFGK